MTCGVIGITLALPTGVYLFLGNLQQISADWDQSAGLSLFLGLETGDTEIERLVDQLRQTNGIAEVAVISREAAMEEFRQLSGFGEALELLPANPLPAVLIVTPNFDLSNPLGAEKLVARLQALPQVDTVQFDMQWIKRFHAFTEIARRATLVITGLLSVAVLLIIGNTVRLEIQTRHSEIEITALVGATNAFIRRPFLYSGVWYGLLGGIVAWILINLAVGLLQGPVNRLAGLYQSNFTLSGPDSFLLLMLLAGSALLGLGGAWVSVGRHLQTLDPE
jgi:cell division transport system permease protein